MWPFVGLYFYRTRPIHEATLWTVFGAMLLLPVGAEIKFPGVPAFDKNSIPNLVALVAFMMILRRLPRFVNRFGVVELLFCASVAEPFITAQLNYDAILVGDRVLPGEDLHEALSVVVAQFIWLTPFFLGRELFRSSEENETILRVVVVAALFYSIPILFEIRASPQLHNWLYGYHAHEFGQQMREGGFRATVFLGHGLVVALFVAEAAIAGAALWRIQARVFRFAPGGVTAYLSAVLILSKSLGALLYAAILVPLVRLANPRAQLRVAVVLASIAVAYPLLRVAHLVPTGLAIDAAMSISVDRGESLEFRFDNDAMLLDRASERFIFGWGRFGRNRIFDEGGKDISVTDGHWIIIIGAFGLFGFITEFGLLTIPVFRAAAALKFAETMRERIMLAALALIVAMNIFDLLLNDALRPWTWLLVGALLGRAEELRALACNENMSCV